jgi:hypothetical protein
MKHPATVALFLFGCVPQAHSGEDSRRLFVRDVSAAVADCARRGAPRVCPEADRLSREYFEHR